MQISFEFIKHRMKLLKVNLLRECEAYGINYRTMQNALMKELDLKASQLVFLAHILDCEIQDLFRKH